MHLRLNTYFDKSLDYSKMITRYFELTVKQPPELIYRSLSLAHKLQ